MIEKWVDHMIQKQVENGFILDGDIALYRYGYLLLVEMLISFSGALLTGIIFHKLGIVFYFHIVFIPLRIFAGGRHADKFWQCALISWMILAGGMILTSVLSSLIQIDFILFFYILCVLVILWMSPVGTKNKPILSEERAIFKRRVFWVVGMESILVLFLWTKSYNEFLFLTTYAYFVQSVLLVTGKRAMDFQIKK